MTRDRAHLSGRREGTAKDRPGVREEITEAAAVAEAWLKPPREGTGEEGPAGSWCPAAGRGTWEAGRRPGSPAAGGNAVARCSPFLVEPRSPNPTRGPDGLLVPGRHLP